MKLEKIRIINWMYFTDSTVRLSGNTAITGANGSGKTSLIDALQYVLIGSRAGTKFNSAQGESRRTLESYVKGHVGDENIKYLRKNNALSYLSIQISNKEEKHVFGIAIDFTGNSNEPKEQRFYIGGKDLDEIEFLEDQKLKTRSEFFKEYKNEVEVYQTVRSYQVALSNVLGLTRQTNYFRLVSNAISRSMRNVNTFIKSFLLEDNPIDIEDAKDLLYKMHQLEAELEINKNRYEKLVEINKQGIKYKHENNMIKQLSIENIYLNYNYLKSRINERENTVKQNQEQISTNDIDIQNYKILESEYNSKIADLKNKVSQDHPDIEKIENELKELESQLNKYISQTKIFDETIKKDIESLSKIEDFNLDDLKSLYRYRKTNNEHKVNELITNIEEQVKLLRQDLDYKRRNNQDLLNKYDELILKTEQEIKKLEQGIHSYPENVEKLIKILKEDFKSNFNEDVEIKPVVEYLELKEGHEDVRNAIEGYLNNHRFDLVIENRHFYNAKKIYEKHKHKIHGIRIINGEKLRYVENIENSLSNYIDATDPITSRYIYNILNEIILVDNVDELRNHQGAITKSCFLYYNNTISQIDPQSYNRPYIGRDAIQIKLKQEKENLELYLEEYKKYNEVLNSVLIKIETLDDFNLLKTNNRYLYNSYIFFNQNEKDYKLKKEEFNEIKTNESFLRLDKQIETLEKEREVITRRISDVKVNIRVLISENENIGKEIDSYNLELEKLESVFTEIDPINVNRLNSKYFEVRITKNVLDEVFKNLRDKKQELRNLIDSIEFNMRHYVRDYFSHLSTSIENIDSFMNEYEDLHKKQIEFTSELVDYRNQYQELVIFGFLDKVEAELDQVNNTVNRINLNLRNKKFGNDSYRIKMEPSKTPELAKIYEIVKEGNLNRNLINYSESDDDINTVTEIISSYLDDSSGKDSNVILDVKNYIEFDVIVKSGKITKSLVDMLDKQSGGETQVPFYILIGAAFEESAEKRREETLCIVLFDEAFSNMDSQRIDKMLTYFKDLNIQVIISIPGMYDAILPHVDTTLIVMRKDDIGGIFDVNKTPS